MTYEIACQDRPDLFTKCLETELTKTEATILLKSKELEFLNTTIIQTLFNLKTEFPLLVAELESLLKEIAAKKQKTVDFQSFEPLTETEKVDALPLPKITIKKHLGIKIKTVYRRIVRLCHPDRTKDLELHRYFISAKQFYETNDVSNLLLVETALKKYINTRSVKVLLDSLLETKLASKRVELASVNSYLENTKDSVLYKAICKSNEGTVGDLHRFYKKSLADKIRAAQKTLLYSFL
jgi:hypothetical protein